MLDVPDSLYYYCSLEGAAHKLWFQELVAGQRIYLRRRDQLNDPNELRPKLVFEGTESEVRSYVKKLIATRYPHLKAPKRLILAQQLHHFCKTQTESDAFSEVMHDVLDRVGIFSLSESPSESQLWAHYAQGHRGACIEVDAKLAPFSLASPVVYTDERPVINRIRDSNDQILQKSCFTKSLQWAYEKEWRVMARWSDRERIVRYLEQHPTAPNDVREFMLSQDGPGHYALPKGAIAGVILGAAASNETRNFVEQIRTTCVPRIRVNQARLEWNDRILIQ